MTPVQRNTQGRPTWAANRQAVLMPTEVSSRVGFFDRFAGLASKASSRAPFFAFCILLVAVWLTQGAVSVAVSGHFSSFLNDRYQLEINTTTTIITFLLVALLQNSQTREDQATQHKLNALADGLGDLMSHFSERANDDTLRRDIRELRAAIGLEDRESTTRNRASGSSPAIEPADRGADHDG
jgi:low affinity Fe/Cu permease